MRESVQLERRASRGEERGRDDEREEGLEGVSTGKCTNMEKYMKQEIANMEERIKILESKQRNMLGEELASCPLKDLNQLESEVERGLKHIRARKSEILVDQIEQLKIKEWVLKEENAFLRKRSVDPMYVECSLQTTLASGFESIQNSEVETQLVMRQPDHDFLIDSSL